MPIPEMIQCYHLTIFSSFVLDRSFQCVFGFLCVFGVWVVFWFVLLLLCVFCGFLHNGIVTAADYVQVPCQFTFCALSLAGLCAPIRFLCSLRHATERVERPGESQLALDGKNGRAC